jgi:PEP-CTERM motif
MRKSLLVLLGAASGLALMTASAQAAFSIDFVGLQNDEYVNSFYAGGTGSLGSGPGPNYGVTFANAYVLNEYDNNEDELNPGPNSITFLSGSGSIMDMASGFTTGFSFNYSAPYAGGSVTVWSGLDGTGTQLASLSLPTTPAYGDPGCGKPYCPLLPFGVTFAGTAESVNFSGSADYIVFDNITVGSGTVITGGVPEPATWAMMMVGFAGLGFAGWRKARPVTSIA